MWKKFLTASALGFSLLLVAAEPDRQGFIRDWLAGGAYPSYVRDGVPQGLWEEPIRTPGGEAMLCPYEGMKDTAVFKADKAKLIAGIGSVNEWGYTETKEYPVVWRKVSVKTEKPYVIFDKMFSPFDDYIVAYAVCYVESPENRAVKLRVGSDDEHRLYLNGRKLGELAGSRGIAPDTAIYDAELKRGLNVIVMKVANITHGFGFCLSVSDPKNVPITDLKIHTDNPMRSAAASLGKTAIPDAWENGFSAWFTLAPRMLTENFHSFSVEFGGPAGTYPCVLTLKRGNEEIRSVRNGITLKKGATAVMKLDGMRNLPAGKYLAVLKIDSGVPVQLVCNVELKAKRQLAGELSAAKKTLDVRKKEMAQAEAKEKQYLQTQERLVKKHHELYRSLEKAYEDQRRAKIARQGLTPELNVPLPAAPDAERTLTLLNGDTWFIAKGTSDPNVRGGYTPPSGNDVWKRVRLPRTSCVEFFHPRHFPVRPKNPKYPHGNMVPLKGWEKEVFDASVAWNSFWVKTELDLKENPAGRAYHFLCDNISGTVKVYLNGTFCGDYSGMVGTVRIPLKNMKSGKNILELYFLDAEKALNTYQHFNNRDFGIRDNLYLESVASPVLVEAVEIRTSWRENTISVATELENRTGKKQSVEIVASCVLNGNVKYRLPKKTAVIPAHGKTVLENCGIWNTAGLWGIGGKYGQPILYDLVTDVYVDGKLADRHQETFGFREFWIAGCDFFLNGKHIILQGDGGRANIDNRKFLDVFLPAFRDDNMNIFRNHDGEFYSPEFLKSCDRQGMLAYVNMYPILIVKNFNSPQKFLSFGDWLKHPLHLLNLKNYRAWYRMFRNHPSVVIVSTDNEIYTQAWDTPQKKAFNIRNDSLGALYSRFVKQLNPALVITRDGDIGTWGFRNRWHDLPECDTANYHYPDFNYLQLVYNWQDLYGYRPAIWGETLYYAYGAWDKFCGPLPSKVLQKARKVRRIAKVYRDWDVPCTIYVGPSSDGYAFMDETGKGNPFGIRHSEHVSGTVPDFPGYPWHRISWPSKSGLGRHSEYARIGIDISCDNSKNWFDPNYPSHIRNAVNEAYRETLIPQPPLAPAPDGECIVLLGEKNAGETVTVRSVKNPIARYAVKADSAGSAWINVPAPGNYDLTVGNETRRVEIGGKASYQRRPGFDRIMTINWNGK